MSKTVFYVTRNILKKAKTKKHNRTLNRLTREIRNWRNLSRYQNRIPKCSRVEIVPRKQFMVVD